MRGAFEPFVKTSRLAAVELRDKGSFRKAETMLLALGFAQEKVQGKDDMESLRIMFELSCVRNSYTVDCSSFRGGFLAPSIQRHGRFGQYLPDLEWAR